MTQNFVVPANPAYKYQVKIEVEWPPTYRFQNKTYCYTGKKGVRFSDKMPCAEYSYENSWIWVGLDGNIKPDSIENA